MRTQRQVHISGGPVSRLISQAGSQFDRSTPGGPNNEAANGQPTGPPAPSRDGLAAVGNLLECFEF